MKDATRSAASEADLHPIWWTHFLDDSTVMLPYALYLPTLTDQNKENPLSRGDKPVQHA
jgi:hypothetical protein